MAKIRCLHHKCRAAALFKPSLHKPARVPKPHLQKWNKLTTYFCQLLVYAGSRIWGIRVTCPPSSNPSFTTPSSGITTYQTPTKLISVPDKIVSTAPFPPSFLPCTLPPQTPTPRLLWPQPTLSPPSSKSPLSSRAQINKIPMNS